MVHRASVNCLFIWCSIPHTISSSIPIFRALSISTSKSLLLRIIEEPICLPSSVRRTPDLLYWTSFRSRSFLSIWTTLGWRTLSLFATLLIFASPPLSFMCQIFCFYVVQTVLYQRFWKLQIHATVR